MAIHDAEPLTLGPWPVGMNNRQRGHALPQGAVRNAVNADIDSAGKLSRRQGCERVASVLQARCGFSCPAGTFLMSGTNLLRLEDDDSSSALGTLTGDHVAYCYAPDGVVYLSDGTVNRKIVSGVLRHWGAESPTQPVVYGVPGGGTFTAGTYLAALTFVDSTGRESGASQVTQVDIQDGSAIYLASTPMSDNPDVTHARFYLSGANGTVLYHRGTVPVGSIATAFPLDDGGAGRVLDAQHLSPTPPGRIIREFGGRMLVAAGPVLWISEPYAYDRVHLGRGFVQFPTDITVVEPVKGGVFVAADKTYFLAGQAVADWQPVVRADYGAVFGTSLRDRNDNPVWTSARGVVMGGRDGSVTNLTEANVAMDTGLSGAAMLREAAGARQFVTAIQTPSVSKLAASDWMDMEVIRRGVSP